MNKNMGVIAGSGEFSLLACKQARKQGYRCITAGIEGQADSKLKNVSDVFAWFDISNLLDVVPFFKKSGVTKVVFAGKIDHLLIMKPKKLSRSVLGLLARGKDRSPSAILKTAIDYLAGHGIEVIDTTTFITTAVCAPGVLSKKRPSRAIMDNIEFGWDIARKTADLDIGQTVIVKNKAIVAIEGIEGTDKAIRRSRDLAGKNTVVVKVCRTIQDTRIDLPAIGLETIKSLVSSECAALCFEAEKMPFFQKEESIELANAHNIVILAKKEY